MGKPKTKDLLLDAGSEAFLERGYANAGIESILQAVGVPKGSFYYYFESKEDFALKVLDRFAACYDEAMDRTLCDTSLSPLGRLRRYFELVLDRIESDHCHKGCLIGKLSQELAGQSETFRSRLEEIFERRVDRYAECLLQARSSGEIQLDVDVRELAEFWLNSWQGALLRAKTMRSTAPLRTFLTMMFGHFLQARA